MRKLQPFANLPYLFYLNTITAQMGMSHRGSSTVKLLPGPRHHHLRPSTGMAFQPSETCIAANLGFSSVCTKQILSRRGLSNRENCENRVDAIVVA